MRVSTRTSTLLDGDDEVKGAEAHACTEDPANNVACHFYRVMQKNGMRRKKPLPDVPTNGVLYYQLVIIVLYVSRSG